MTPSKYITLGLLLSALAAMGGEGGSIKGVVLYDGEPPEMKPRKVTDAACNCEEVPNESLVVNQKTRAIKWVIVRLMMRNMEEVKPPEESVKIDTANCIYTPHVLIAAPGQRVEVISQSGVHNPHLISPQSLEYGVSQKSTVQKKFLKGLKEIDIHRLVCDFHPWMKCYIVVHDPRFCAATADDGKFDIKDVPPGKYKLNIFQEVCGETTVDVEVKANAATDIGEFKMKKPARK